MSGIATGTALAIGLGTAGSIGSAVIGSNAAGKAGQTQAQAAEYAAQLQKQSADASLGFQKQVYDQTQANQAPFLQAGQSAVNTLSGLTSTPGQGLLQNYPGQFTAPTAEQAQQTPGYQFTLGQGLQALDRGAAARGNLLTGGTMQAEQQYGQGLASQTYQQTFNNALTQYQNAYNQFNQGQANTYNRLAGLAGTGQVSANQLASSGQQAANTTAGINSTLAAQQGQDFQNAAAATASGYVGSANAYGGALSNSANSLGNYALLNSLVNSQGSGQLSNSNLYGSQSSMTDLLGGVSGTEVP